METDDISSNITINVAEIPHTPRSAALQNYMKDAINNTYKNDIQESLLARKKCRKAGHCLEIISQIFCVASTILAFGAGFYDNKILSFIAGGLGTLALATLKSAAFSLKESKERTASINMILKNLNLQTLPEIVENA